MLKRIRNDLDLDLAKANGEVPRHVSDWYEGRINELRDRVWDLQQDVWELEERIYRRTYNA